MSHPVQLPMIKCNDIDYRQGFVEVSAGIHAKHVNVEVWNVHPDQDIAALSRVDQLASDEAVVGNAEIELSIPQANALIEALQQAVQLASRGGGLTS